jgi:hypothetical protein
LDKLEQRLSAMENEIGDRTIDLSMIHELIDDPDERDSRWPIGHLLCTRTHRPSRSEIDALPDNSQQYLTDFDTKTD